MIKEKRISLEFAQEIDPLDIDSYILKGGFKTLQIAFNKPPQEIIKQVTESGLRGRGGAGFPTGLKGKFTDEALCKQCGQKFVVCNADEGEPGTFKDRIIMEQVPFRLIEGMLLSAYGIGANKGYIYIRGEYAKSIKQLSNAIKICYNNGFLGDNIAGSDFSFDLELKLGAGSYLCGEELTLLESLEGKRGYPRIKPPFPAEYGLWGKPTLINNVETFANIPFIIKNGALKYRQLGTEKSPGTKIFTVSGDVEKPGYYELEMGATLRQIIEELCGGIKNNGKFQTAIIGGAAGSFVNESIFDTPIGFDTLKEKGVVLGSGAILVLDDTRSIKEMLQSILEFFKHESCGKCVPCRVGTAQLIELMNELWNCKKGECNIVLNRMLDEARYMKKSSLCPLGQSPIIPIQSLLSFMEDEV